MPDTKNQQDQTDDQQHSGENYASQDLGSEEGEADKRGNGNNQKNEGALSAGLNSIPGGRYGKVVAKFVGKHKKSSATGAVITGVAIFLFFASGSLLNLVAVFKLMHLAGNIEDVRMSRLKYTMDERSDRFIETMIAAEVAGEREGDSNRNRYFVARGWSRDHPFTQWYRDMKTSNFFEELEQNTGTRFIRQTSPDGPDRLAAIRTDSGELQFNRDGSVANMSPDELDARVSQVYDRNQDARRAWKQAVRQQTKSYQILQRRNLRRWGMEKLGIRKWRFFENTRDNARERVRARWTRRTTLRARSGSFLRCLFSGGSRCPTSSSLNDPDNETPPPGSGQYADEVTEAIEEGTEEARQTSETPDSAVRNTGVGKSGRLIAKRMVSKFIPVVNIAEWIIIFQTVDQLLGDEERLTNMIAVSRQNDYAASWFTFRTATDHLKAGDEVAPEEVNALMEMYNGVESSEGYRNVFQPESQNTANTTSESSTVFAQSQSAQSDNFAEITDDMQVNSEDTNAQDITDFYQGTFGRALSPIVGICETVGVCELVNIASGAIGSVLDVILTPLRNVITTITPGPVKDTFREAVSGIGEWIFTSLGGAPVCTGQESAGQLFNCIDGGAVVTQNQFLQSIGGSKLSEQEQERLEQETAMSKLRRRKQQSAWTRYASLNNHNSLASSFLMQVPTSSEGLGRRIAGIFNFRISDSINAILAPFNVFAQGQDTRKDGEEMYGVTPYGHPVEKLDQLPFAGQSQAECEQEKRQFRQAMRSGNQTRMENASSICLTDEVVANNLKSMLTDEDDGGVNTGQRAGNDEGGGGGDADLPSGAARELAGDILRHDNITFDPGVRNSFVQVNQNGAASTGDGDQVNVSSQLLSVILAIANEPDMPTVRISSLTGGGHSNESLHYEGKAVDIGNERIADRVVPFVYQNRQNFGIDELIYACMANTPNLKNGDPNEYGLEVLYGRDKSSDCDSPPGSPTRSGHENHIHIATSQ